MKKLLLLVAFAAGSLALSGCTGTSDAEKKEAFFEVVRVAPELADSSEEGLTEVAEALCEVMDKADDGKGWEAATLVADGAGISASSTPLLVAASVMAFCPEHEEEVPAEHLGS